MVNPIGNTTRHDGLEHIWQWLEAIPDPEMPYISIVDLGIVREVNQQDGQLHIVITPTYSGCPAKMVIEQDIRRTLADHGVLSVSLKTRLFPAWSTDWMSQEGREKLRAAGIAPPLPAEPGWQQLKFFPLDKTQVCCPCCGSEQTCLQSEFGGTACKALWLCDTCLNPFEHFKSL
ncbi:phenylacetate-CoA oxygenase subunit PaaJ [Photorhabdus luminescens]|uniref:1,2-phenylacetyl-CoA epoxidase subunit PaaD n=1 Tax=Photorhabdus akhurstii TaxID=171438 RepID=UPI000CF980EF|nr:phenylacetate-CoA oxygenase subunit PaaJ [Photorhabdus luminescens]PQQ34046.1 phenylacetate-CoA oxygenase subunit PaaJ [Photorhabdus luminescens]